METTGTPASTKKRPSDEMEGTTSTETSPEQAAVKVLQTRLIESLATIIPEDKATSVAEYIIHEKHCSLGEDPILLVNYLPALNGVVSKKNFIDSLLILLVHCFVVFIRIILQILTPPQILIETANW